MNFNDLDSQKKQQLHDEFLIYATNIGGINHFLQMVEDIKSEKQHPLLNKSSAFPFSKGRLTWNKPVFKDTLTLLFNAMRKEEKDGDMLNGLNPKDYKLTMNMMRTLKPISITVKAKDNNELSGFSFSILDTTIEKNTKVSMLYKTIFFYNVEFAKQILNYNQKDS